MDSGFSRESDETHLGSFKHVKTKRRRRSRRAHSSRYKCYYSPFAVTKFSTPTISSNLKLSDIQPMRSLIVYGYIRTCSVLTTLNISSDVIQEITFFYAKPLLLHLHARTASTKVHACLLHCPVHDTWSTLQQKIHRKFKFTVRAKRLYLLYSKDRTVITTAAQWNAFEFDCNYHFVVKRHPQNATDHDGSDSEADLESEESASLQQQLQLRSFYAMTKKGETFIDCEDMNQEVMLRAQFDHHGKPQRLLLRRVINDVEFAKQIPLSNIAFVVDGVLLRNDRNETVKQAMSLEYSMSQWRRASFVGQ